MLCRWKVLRRRVRNCACTACVYAAPPVRRSCVSLLSVFYARMVGRARHFSAVLFLNA